MPFNNMTDRTDVAALIPEDVAKEIIQGTVQQSAARQLFRELPMSRKQQRMPVLSALPIAYWVNGDTGLKQTTEMAWANKYLNVEELACIVPIPEAVLDDSEYDIWGEVRPRVEEAIGRALDAAIFFGASAPAAFPTNVAAAAVAAGNVVNIGTSAAAQGGFFGDFDLALEALDGDGYDPTGMLAATTIKGKFRRARNTLGDKTDADRVDRKLSEVDGYPITYPMRGLWPTGAGAAQALVGDWSQYVLGVRQDITYKMLDQAVITDNTGAIIFNLAQQDMIAMRVVFRAGWQVANPINFDQPTEANRYPVAVLRNP